MADKVNISDAVNIQDVLAPSVLVGVVLLFVARLAFAGQSPYVRLGPREDAEAAIRYLSEQHAGGDLLYIHSTIREHYKFYSKRWPINGGRIVKGNIGWPCCPRGIVSDRGVSPAKVMPVEITRLGLSSESRNVRLLFTGRQFYWHTFLRRDEPHEFALRLSEKGCIRARTKEFTGIQIDEYLCRLRSSQG
jgi:hypothetical protein